MTKYLRCHTSGSQSVAGEVYKVVREDKRNFYTDECGSFSKLPDSTGKSYRNWFTLETESDEAVTLLPDESLGGLMREYNEVKRKARVGEWVKVTVEETLGEHHRGELYTVVLDEGNTVNTDGRWDDGSALNFAEGEYVVLEASDILRVDNTRFRMVERKAAVGERVVITDWKADNHVVPNAYQNGDVATVTKKDYFVIIPHVGNPDFVALAENEYRVLEPLTDAIPTQLSSLDPVDQYVENIAVLATKVQALEERVATLESSVSFERNMRGVAELSVTESELTARANVIAPKKTPQQIRDEIVARAKADVVRLSNTPIHSVKNSRRRIGFWPHGSEDHRYLPIDFVEFSVNRDKRTVVAMIRSDNEGVWLRGIAKAAPGEVFNSYIGKAIALHRALGLEVPAEYMKVPAPTEVRVGDIVEGGVVYAVRPTHSRYGSSYMSADLGYTLIDSRGSEWWDLISDASIIDDSREESEGVSA